MANRVLGVLAGDRLSPGLLERWADEADVLVAGDGGANSLASIGRTPSATVGDLDSVRPDVLARLPGVIKVEDQDHSDVDKLLQWAGRNGHRRVTLIGGEGSRTDHMLAVWQSAAKSGLSVRVVYEQLLAEVLSSPVSRRFSYEGLLSLLPLSECSGVTLSGVRWPLIDTVLSPTGLSSLSNRGQGEVEVQLQSGTAVLFVDHGGRVWWD